MMKNRLLFFLTISLLATHIQAQEADSAIVNTIDSLLNNVRELSTQGEFDAALGVNEFAEKLALKKVGQTSAEYASCCFNRGRIYYLMGQYPEAKKWYLESKTVREKVLGKEHQDYAWSLNNLGIVEHLMGNYESAEQLYAEALYVRKKLFGAEHPLYASTLSNLALLYTNMGNYEQAEPLCLEAKAIRRRILGIEHPDYWGSTNNLAILYHEMGDYKRAEPYFLEALGIMEKYSRTDLPSYATSLNNLGTLYRTIGNFEKAKTLFLKARDIRERTLGVNHPDYAWSLNNLGIVYSDLEDYKKAAWYYNQANKIWKKTFGKNHPDYASGLDNLAIAYSDMNEDKESEKLHLQAIKIRKKALGEEHPEYAGSLYNLAILYSDLGRYKKAARLFSKAKSIRFKSLGKQHPNYAWGLVYEALLNERQGFYSASEPLLEEYAETERSHLSLSASFLSEQELAQNVKLYQSRNNVLLSFLFARDLDRQGNLPSIAFNNSLFFKGFLQHSAIRINVMAASNPRTRDLNSQLKICRRRLAKEYSKPIAEQEKVSELESNANAMEKELAVNLEGYAQALMQVNWQEVQAALKEGEAAIEFIHFRVNYPKAADSTVYVALLLRPGWERPRFMPLFVENEWMKVCGCAALTDSECAKKRYSQKNISPIYDLGWKPLDSLLAGVEIVYYVPSGQLHLLDFDAINVGSGKTLADRYQLVRLGSTRQLAVSDLESIRPQNLALLFGGVLYDADSIDITTSVRKLDTLGAFKMRGPAIEFVLPDSTFHSMAWVFLDSTQQEVDNINPIVKTAGMEAHTFYGADATEDSFKRIGQGIPPPRIIHLATHGFFYPNPKTEKAKKQRLDGQEPVFKISDHPMIRSGLIFAGANHAWLTGKPLIDSIEDGIVTAYEISQMNLRGTELVVLSACETGLGDLERNEGVFGLQRAFKIAGARYLIMSLQRVPDGPTQEFMTLLYQYWLGQNKPLPKAFHEAKSTMRKKYPDQPLNWSGWVLVE